MTSFDDECERWVTYVRHEVTHSLPSRFLGQRKAIHVRDPQLAKLLADLLEDHLIHKGPAV